MVDSYLSTKFAVDMLDGFSENLFYGRRTTHDGPFPHGISSADTVKTTQNSRKVLGRAEKTRKEKKNLAEQQCAYQRSIVLVGHHT